MFVNTNMDKITVENAFNVLVNLARQTKLTYQEHLTVEGAVNTVLEALKKKEEPAAPVVLPKAK